MILQAAVVVSDAKGHVFAPGAVRIKRTGPDRGLILATGKRSDVQPVPGEPVMDLGGLWLIPGLIQAHVHLNQTLFRGLAEQRTLMQWLRDRIWPLEAAHDYDSVHASARQSIAEMLLSGVTGALTMETANQTIAAFDACEELGIRARVGTALMDKLDSGMPDGLYRDLEDALVEMVMYDREFDDDTAGRVRGCIAPRFVPSCSDALLQRSIEIAREHGMVWHSHVSENEQECDEVRARTGMENLEYFNSIGALGPLTSLAHGVWLTPDEMQLAAATGTSLLHCPSANLKLGSGVADTKAMRDAGVNVALGSDGAPCNNRLDIFADLRLAGLLLSWKTGPDKTDAAEVFRFATEGGARALGLEGRIGALREGHYADLTALSPGLFNMETPTADAVYRHLVFAASHADVKHVWVDGKQVVKNCELQTADIGAIRSRYREQQTRVLQRVGF